MCGSFRFDNFERDACVVFGADDFEERTHGARRLSTATDDVSHVFLVNVQCNENTPLVHGSLGANFVRLIHDGPNDVFDKLLILFHIRR